MIKEEIDSQLGIESSLGKKETLTSSTEATGEIMMMGKSRWSERRPTTLLSFLERPSNRNDSVKFINSGPRVQP